MPDEKALRVAALLASLEEYENIHLTHWARGQQIAEEWRASLHRIYYQVNQTARSPEAELEQRILQVVARTQNPTTAEISAYIKNHSTVQIGRAADGLAELGLLEVTTKPWGNRLIKRYQLPQIETKSG